MSPAGRKADQAQDPPAGRGVYCNRTLNLRSIKAIGYDMDYTLVHYHHEVWERRAYQHAKRRLAERGWPVAELDFDAGLVVRGLVIDTERGNVLKVDRFGFVKAALHGTCKLDFDDTRAAYMRTMVDLADSRFRFLNTLFELSEGCMYAQLVDLLDRGKIPGALGYGDLFAAVRANVDATHTEGELKAEIIRGPERFVSLDAETPLALLDQKTAGKRLLLITNSEWHYTNEMMRWAFDRFLPGSMAWRDLFDVVVVQARKPAFLDGDAPLLRVIDDQGRLEPHVGPLQPGGAYFGGNAALLERHLGLSGDEVLYFGDHMFGDVHVSKRALRWRTGLILRELEEELAAIEALGKTSAELAELMAEKESLEHRQCQIRLAQMRKKHAYADPEPSATGLEPSGELGRIRKELGQLDERIAPLAVKAATVPNPRWGLLLRAGNDKSQLARQVERYADVYTSRVSNLVYVTPFAYLRSSRGSLPHDPV